MSNLDKVIQFYYIPSVWNIEKTFGFEIKRIKWDDGSECRLSSKWIKQLITWHLLFKPTHFSSDRNTGTRDMSTLILPLHLLFSKSSGTKITLYQSDKKVKVFSLLMIQNIQANWPRTVEVALWLMSIKKSNNKKHNEGCWVLYGNSQSLQKNCNWYK